MTAPDAQPSPRELGPRELAGYRLLRSLALDEHAEVLLGHRRATASDSESPNGEPDAGVQTVAIKVLPASDGAWAATLRACAALERARGDHVVDLLDLDSDEESIRLIFERLPCGDLAELLRMRPRLDAGEAVTVLAPIAATLLRMHEAGVAHGSVNARTVLFRDDGSPTLIGFSAAELFEPHAPEVVLEQVDSVRRDRAAAASLAALVLGRVDGSRARAARELIADVEGRDDELVLPLLVSRLFDVAAAVPIRFQPDEPEDDLPPSMWRTIPVGQVADEPVLDRGGSLSRWTAAVGSLVPESVARRVLERVERSPVAPVLAAAAEAVRRRWGSWTAGRRRMVLAVTAAGATVAIAMAAVPSGAVATGSAPPTASPTASPTARSSSDSPTAGAQVDTSDSVVTADDPVAATTSLVRTRDRCLSSLSLRCLEKVDEDGSSALAGDQMAIRAAQRGGELPDPLSGETGGGPAVLIERLGDSALVRLGQAASSASLLLVKGDAGWRIRDVVDGAAAGDVPGNPSTTPTPAATPTPTGR